ncbi:hypothetical protein ACS15_0408 [Ralstonia insidiosa]|uniref:Uncharacterized protein n=1 Tax=Ralstonia insidiosa TaxID=190721 RepID=A0AAC9BGR2_9RALS|nr:hypothetical protein ACS15_0408 [Ralstonia insidiosa]
MSPLFKPFNAAPVSAHPAHTTAMAAKVKRNFTVYSRG